jgi:hypothetical protein
MDNVKQCVRCGKKIEGKHASLKKFCTRQCSIKDMNEKYNAQNPPILTLSGKCLDSQQVGTIGELVVIIDLMKKGYHVYRNIVHSSYCDLAVVNGKTLLRVEVKTGFYSPTGLLCYPSCDKKDRYDHLAVWTKSGGLVYIPELPDLVPD